MIKDNPNQSHLDGQNKQVLDIDESIYSGDAEMLYILHRLQEAASDSQLRHDMNVEDEYYSAIEMRDTAILLKDKQIAEQNATIKEKEDTIKEKEDTIKEKEDTIKEQEALLRSTIKMLMNAGMTLGQIAANLGVDMQVVNQLTLR